MKYKQYGNVWCPVREKRTGELAKALEAFLTIVIVVLAIISVIYLMAAFNPFYG
jgi:hypothetical protein